MHQGSNAVGKGSWSEFGHGHPASTTTLPLGGAEGVDPQPAGRGARAPLAKPMNGEHQQLRVIHAQAVHHHDTTHLQK